MKKIILIAMLVGVASVFAGPQKNPVRGPIVVQASVVAMENAKQASEVSEIAALTALTNALKSASTAAQIKTALETWANADASAKKAKKQAETEASQIGAIDNKKEKVK